MAAYREEINARLPNTTNILGTLGLILRQHLQKAAEHCETKKILDEFDAISDTVLASHLLDAVDTVLKSYVHVYLPKDKKGGKP